MDDQMNQVDAHPGEAERAAGSGAAAGCRASARRRRCFGYCAEKTWRPSRASWASQRRRATQQAGEQVTAS